MAGCKHPSVFPPQLNAGMDRFAKDPNAATAAMNQMGKSAGATASYMLQGAETQKAEGNRLFKEKKYHEAIEVSDVFVYTMRCLPEMSSTSSGHFTERHLRSETRSRTGIFEGDRESLNDSPGGQGKGASQGMSAESCDVLAQHKGLPKLRGDMHHRARRLPG